MRAPSRILLAAAAVGCVPVVALARAPGRFDEPPSTTPSVGPRVVVQDDAGASVISLSRIEDPLALERRLRELASPPYREVRLRVANGQAQVGDFAVGPGASVVGDLLVLGGSAEVRGRIDGNVVALDGDIVVHRGATVAGDALALGGRVRSMGGTVLGESQSVSTSDAPPPAPRGVFAATTVRLAGVLGVFVTLALVGSGLVLFGRSHFETVSDTASHSFLRSFFVGLLSQVLIVPTFGMVVAGLVLSVVGVLLVPFVVVVYGLLVIVGVVGGLLAVTHALGETHTRRRMARGEALSPNSFRYLAFGLGSLASVWLAWAVFAWVPVASGLVLAAAVLATWLLGTVGLGATVLSRAGIQPQFAGRYVPTEMLTDEYLWATPQQGVPAVRRPDQR